MTRGIHNWNFHDVTTFLHEKNFKLNHTEGSHHFYFGIQNGKLHQVCVPFHGSRTIKPRTFKGIIAQSGISQKEWLNK